jgi:hypothetical protein
LVNHIPMFPRRGQLWNIFSSGPPMPERFNRGFCVGYPRVLVSFTRHGRAQVQSFPRKRESTPQAIGDAPPTDWIPAFTGMVHGASP